MYSTGQKLICINKEGWKFCDNGKDTDYGPIYGEEVTCEGVLPEDPKYIYLKEYPRLDPDSTPSSFHSEQFKPAAFKGVVQELAQQSLKIIEEKIDRQNDVKRRMAPTYSPKITEPV